VGLLWRAVCPEAYQYFPYFAVVFTATLLQTTKEQDQGQDRRFHRRRNGAVIFWRFMPIEEKQAQSLLPAEYRQYCVA